MEEVAFACEVDPAKHAHEPMENGRREAIRLVDEKDHGLVEHSALPGEEAPPPVPIGGRGGLERERLAEQARRDREEDLVRVVRAESGLHGHHADSEAIAVACADLGDGAAHDPRLPRLSRRPDGEIVSAVTRLPDELRHGALDEIAALHAKMEPGVDGAVGAELPHGRILAAPSLLEHPAELGARQGFFRHTAAPRPASPNISARRHSVSSTRPARAAHPR